MAHTRWTSSLQRRYRRGQVRQHRHASHPIMTVMRRPARGGNDLSSMLRYRGRVAESVALWRQQSPSRLTSEGAFLYCLLTHPSPVLVGCRFLYASRLSFAVIGRDVSYALVPALL